MLLLSNWRNAKRAECKQRPKQQRQQQRKPPRKQKNGAAWKANDWPEKPLLGVPQLLLVLRADAAEAQ